MELIKITEQNGKKAVSARELHSFLEVKNHFTQWFDDNKNQFDENIDYQAIKVFLKHENGIGGTYKMDYALTLDTAKEMAMLSKVPKGKQARRYFIECEKVAKNPLKSVSRIDLARMVIETEEENQRLQLEAKENAPKILFTEAVIGSSSSCLIGELAKIISQNGYKIRQNRLFEWLRNKGFLGTKGERYNVPNQQYIEQGLFEIKKGVRTGNEGVMHTTITSKGTGKGQVYFVNKFLSKNISIENQ